MHNQKLMNEWYLVKPSVRTSRHNNGWELSGEKLSEKVEDHELVLDVGCGPNRYKEIINNVVGIDPANEHADVHCTIEDFDPPHLFDVAFCLSSINFGTEEIINNQIKKVVECLKPKARIYWRLAPEFRQWRTDDGEIYLSFYQWTFEKLQKFADLYGFEQRAEAKETNTLWHPIQQKTKKRLYAEWHRG